MADLTGSDQFAVYNGSTHKKITADQLSQNYDGSYSNYRLAVYNSSNGTHYSVKCNELGSKISSSNQGSYHFMISRGSTLYKVAAEKVLGLLNFPAFISNTWDSSYGFLSEDLHAHSSGNTYVVGYNDAHPSQDNYIIKLNESGAVAWKRSLNHYREFSYGVSADDAGNVYSSGWISEVVGDAGKYDIGIFKLNSSGTLQWSRRLGVQTSESSRNHMEQNTLQCTETDGSGNTYICGYDVGPAYSANTVRPLLAKWNTNGTLQWQKVLTDSIIFYAITLESSGNNIYAGGGGPNSSVVTKWNSSGTLLLQKTISFSGYIGDMATDIENNVYVVADNRENSEQRVSIFKLNSSGTILWQRKISVGQFDRYPAVTVTTSGRVIVAFDSYASTNPQFSIRLVSFDSSSGSVQWQRSIYDSSFSYISLKALSPDKGNFAILFNGNNSSGTKINTTLKLPGDGSKTGTLTSSGGIGSQKPIEYQTTSDINVTTTNYSISNSSYGTSNVGLPERSGGLSTSVENVGSDSAVL
jgi:hypothetical protein